MVIGKIPFLCEIAENFLSLQNIVLLILKSYLLEGDKSTQ